jgi:hypothetical protein
MTGVTFKSRPSAAESYCGVAADWEFIRLSTTEPMVVVYKGFEFASGLVQDANGIARAFAQATPCNYAVPLNQTSGRAPWRELMLALDTPSHLADFDWQYPHDLLDNECFLSPVAAFRLPRTLDDYLASLSKDNRYEFRRVNRLCEHLTVSCELPSPLAVSKLLECFVERQGKKYDWYFAPEDIASMQEAMQRFIDRAKALGTLFPLSVYDGDTVVAVNIAENVNGRIIDTIPIYDFAAHHHLGMGTFLINQNIERAIAHGCTWYDLGVLDSRLDEPRIGREPYSDKSKWLPKQAVTPYPYGYAVLSAKQRPVPPYIDFDTKELRVSL